METDLAGYASHPLHTGGTYLETNCYVDVRIELLHARGDEPLAMLGFIVGTDWEGDQRASSPPPSRDDPVHYHPRQVYVGFAG